MGWGLPGGGIWEGPPSVSLKTAIENRPQEVPHPDLGPAEWEQSLQKGELVVRAQHRAPGGSSSAFRKDLQEKGCFWLVWGGEEGGGNQAGESGKTEMWNRKLCLFLSGNLERKRLRGSWAEGVGKAEAARR